MDKNKKDTINIDRIIDLVKQIADALTKSDFLSEEEQRQLKSYQSCKSKIDIINEVRRVRGQTALSEDKQRQTESKHNYDQSNARALKYKLEQAQAEHIESTIKLQEDLDLYLAPHWPEILKLTTWAYPLQKEIEFFVNADFGIVDKGNVTGKAKDVKSELKRIKAKLKYAQTQTPEAKVQSDKSEKPVETDEETRTRKKPKLSKCHIKAWDSYQWLKKNRSDLTPRAEDKKNFTLDMYNCVMDESPKYHDDDDKSLKSVPGYDAWKRYIRFYLQRMTEATSQVYQAPD